ncbi:MAG: sulfotransferase [Alphaproteobacteria bacterium]|nr:sulfotransferase [Alphaproteobacteria bacterium]
MSFVRRIIPTLAEAGARWFAPAWPRSAEALLDAVALDPADRAAVAAPLAALHRACADEAALSAIGRAGWRWDALRSLENLRRMRAEEAKAPDIAATPIERPLIITGMPRSGTSFFFGLLAEDPAALVPRVWQTIHPYPDAGTRPGASDRRQRRVARQLAAFNRLAPGLASVHPLDADSPQECTEITAQVFQSLRFETMYQVPAYKRWLAEHGHLAAYRFHRRFLQHLQHQRAGARAAPGHWLLKSPDHVFALPTLRAVYPDARLVFVHRDPLKVLPSVAQLTEILRAPFTRRVDRAGIGQQVVQDWVNAAAIMVAEHARPTFPAGQVLHLRHRDVVSRPLATVQQVAAHFGLDLSAAVQAAMARHIAARPRGGYGENHYSFATHGLDPEAIRAQFAEYVETFGVADEVETPPRPSAVRAAGRRPVGLTQGEQHAG